MFKKLTSRKFWLAVLGAITPYGIAALTGELSTTEAARLSTAAVVTYILAEAGIDIKGAGRGADRVR